MKELDGKMYKAATAFATEMAVACMRSDMDTIKRLGKITGLEFKKESKQFWNEIWEGVFHDWVKGIPYPWEHTTIIGKVCEYLRTRSACTNVRVANYFAEVERRRRMNQEISGE